MKVFIRNKPRWIIFINDINQLRELIDYYNPGQSILIGDIALFSKNMINVLLKFVEENPNVDCYSSEDISDKVLLSRAVQVIKDPMMIIESPSEDEFEQSSKGYNELIQYCGRVRNDLKLRAYHAPKKLYQILFKL